MMFITFRLFVILTLHYVVQGQCTDFTVYDENMIEINATGVCLKNYSTKDCIDFYRSFNKSQLPQGFPTSTSVESPNNISGNGIDSPYVSNKINYMYPGFSIRWESPYSDISKEHCNGYLLVWYNGTASETKCRLFEMQTGNTRKLTYQYNIKYIYPSSSYTVRVYSMPPVDPIKKDEDKAFVSMNVMTGAAYHAGFPGEWAPSLAYKTFSNGTINLNFALPPADFNITQFYVYLTDINNENQSFEKLYTAELRTQQNTQLFVTLIARYRATYTIAVWVKDDLHKQEGVCKCWIIEDIDRRTCKNACGGTTTQRFYFNVTDPQTTEAVVSTTTTTTTTTTTAGNIISPSSDDQKKLILALTVGITSVVVVVIIIIILVCRRKTKEPEKPPKTDPSNILDDDTDSAATFNSERKTVYIMSADDHDAHVELVDSFAAFLKKHCHCNVILPSECQSGAYAWFQYSLRKSDFIIFINSEGAKKLIEAHMEQKTYKNRDIEPEMDFFTFGLAHIMVSPTLREEPVILVSFHDNIEVDLHCQRYLQITETCRLPKRLPKLLRKIHSLTVERAKIFSSVLPLYIKNLDKLPEGAQMQSAARNVQIYEHNNPEWFMNKFGDFKAQKFIRLESSESKKSGDSGFAGDSVSQNFNPNSPTHDPNDDTSVAGHECKQQESNFSDKLSCFTVNEVHGKMNALESERGSEINSLIPPETISKIDFEHYSTLSTAFDEINRNNNNSHHYQRTEIDSDFENTIVPPANPSDIQVDSISSAFAAINVNSETSVLPANTNLWLSDENSNLDYNSVSI